MKWIKLTTFFFVTAALLGIFLTKPQTVMANSVCTTNPPACIIQSVWYTWDYPCFCVTDPYTLIRSCQTCQQSGWYNRCTIPQADGTSCVCCFNDGCYLDCPSVNPTGGGPPAPSEEPPPPGSTNTPIPTSTPMPIGTINAVARVVSADTTCTAVSSSAEGVAGTIFGFSPSSKNQPAPLTQSGNTPVSFTSQPAGSYTIDYTPPAPEWTLAMPCIYRNSVLTAYGQSATLIGGDTLEWRFGFTRGTPWVQTQGGDVYAASSIRSYIPGVTPRVFNADNAAGYPGVVMYGTTYDFDTDWAARGGTYISSKNWVVQDTRTPVDYYDFFYRRYGAPTTPSIDPAFSNPLAVTKPSSSEIPHYVIGDMTTSGNWSVGANESIVVIVDGNLTIGGRVLVRPLLPPPNGTFCT